MFWGSTAAAIRLAVASISPWWMAAIRFAVAGSLLFVWCRLRGTALPQRREWIAAAASGIVLLAISNGLFSWTEQYLPSGVGALFFALSPLWMTGFAFAFDGERPSRLGALGLCVGLAGMFVVYSPAGGLELPVFPTLVGVLTSVTWAFGSVLQRRFFSTDIVQTSAMQMLAASVALGAVAVATRAPLTPASFTPASTGALAYLIVFGSIAGFSAFLWVVRKLPTALASTYAYVNPVVSLAIGIGLLHERFSWQLAAGAAIALVGVAIVMLAPRPSTRAVRKVA